MALDEQTATASDRDGRVKFGRSHHRDMIDALDHDAFRGGAGAFLGYGLILAAMTVLLFGVPYALFAFVF